MNTETQKDTLGVIKDGRVYRVAEIVTPQGQYITWPTAHQTSESAYAEIREFKRLQSRKENV